MLYIKTYTSKLYKIFKYSYFIDPHTLLFPNTHILLIPIHIHRLIIIATFIDINAYVNISKVLAASFSCSLGIYDFRADHFVLDKRLAILSLR